MNMDPMVIEPATMAYLCQQPWKGNVRELINYVRRLTVFSNGQTIDLPLIHLVEGKPDHPAPASSPQIRYKDAKKVKGPLLKAGGDRRNGC